MGDVVILLRGVNVGGNRMIPMAELRSLLAADGFENAETLLQSGNAIVGTQATSTEAVEERIAKLLSAHYGAEIDVHARTHQEWSEITSGPPLEASRNEIPSRVLVTFFHDLVNPDYVQALREFASGGELIDSVGRELYIAYPNGISDSKLGRMPGWSKVAASGTGRNWNTVSKLRSRLEARAS